MKRIPLSMGLFAVVDDSDYQSLSIYKWRAFLNPSNGKYYAMRSTYINKFGSTMRMHRQITNCPSGMDVDHANGDTLDNRRCNLRVCTRSQNLSNRNGSKTRKSKYKGVSFCVGRDKWVMQIQYDGKRIAKRFDTELDAAIAYNAYAINLQGEFCRLNEVD